MRNAHIERTQFIQGKGLEGCATFSPFGPLWLLTVPWADTIKKQEEDSKVDQNDGKNNRDNDLDKDIKRCYTDYLCQSGLKKH
eukprot:2037063-Amphidinium_carterae.1